MRTRNWLWHDPRPFPVARKIAKRALKANPKFRRAKWNCPGCRFDMLITNETGIWCPSCGLMAPANCIYSVKTGKRVKF